MENLDPHCKDCKHPIRCLVCGRCVDCCRCDHMQMFTPIKEFCLECKGVIFPFSQEDPDRCKCVPSDYEQCNECHYDHSYEVGEAIAWHFENDSLLTEVPDTAEEESYAKGD